MLAPANKAPWTHLSFLPGTAGPPSHLNPGRDALPRVQADQQVGPTGMRTDRLIRAFRCP